MIEFDEVNHLYYVDGRLIPSVSQIIRAVCGSCYENIPQDVRDRAAFRGSAVHAMTELSDKGAMTDEIQDYVNTVYNDSAEKFGEPIDISPYFTAWLNRDCATGSFSHIEHRFCHDLGDGLTYCGTIDRIAGSTVYDLKTSSAKDVEAWSMQLTAYTVAMGMDTIAAIWFSKKKSGEITAKEVPLTMRTKDWESVLRVFYMVHYKKWREEALSKQTQEEF